MIILFEGAWDVGDLSLLDLFLTLLYIHSTAFGELLVFFSFLISFLSVLVFVFGRERDPKLLLPFFLTAVRQRFVFTLFMERAA